jgi:homoserine kinase type II
MEFSKENIAETFQDNYNLGVVKRIEPLKKGVANKLYKVETSEGEYVFKVAIRNTEDERVFHEVEFLNRLSDIPSPKPIKTKSGKFICLFQNFSAFAYPFLPGEAQEKLDASLRKQAGEALARIHLQSKNFSTPVSGSRIRLWDIPGYYSLETLHESIKKTAGESIRNAALYAYEHIKEYYVDAAQLPAGSMHMDFKPENILCSDGRLTGIVDFDNSYIGPLALDLAYALLWFGKEDDGLKLSNMDEFLDGYQKIRPLTEAEKASLYPYIHFLCLAIILVNTHWLFDKHLPLPEAFTQWCVDAFLPAHKELLARKAEFNVMLK